jgi:hypothetical protein
MTIPTPDQLEVCIGQAATVMQDSGEPIALILKRVRRAAQRGVEDAGDLPVKDGFSVDLRGPLDPVLAPMTYPVTFPGLEVTHLFISAYHQDENETFYEILFA